MTAYQRLTFDDGSTLEADAEAATLAASGGIAEPVRACAEWAAALPAVEALAWFRGDASGPSCAVRTLRPGLVSVTAGGERAQVPSGAYRDALALAWAVALDAESFWVLRAEPLACVAGPGDRAFATTLEPKVAAFDAAVRAHALDDATGRARRRAVLADLRAAGLLDAPLLELKADVLVALGCPALADKARAAHALFDYAASRERAHELKVPAPQELDRLGLALEWPAAAATPPAGFTRFAWWAACERALGDAAGDPEPDGSLFFLQGSVSAELLWRAEDDGRKVLYGLRLRARR